MDELNPLKNPEEYQDKVLELMRSYELLLAELYDIYSEKFIEHKEFWLKTSNEEKTHAYWIETLANQIGNEKIYFNKERFNIPPLNECIAEANLKITQAKNEDLAMIEAVSISYIIEKGMIERKFFEVFESDSPEIKKTFDMLREATIEHARLMKEMWDSERARAGDVKTSFWQRFKNLFK